MSSTTFPQMHEKIPEGEVGTAKVAHFEITKPSNRMMMRPDEYVAPGKYAQLLIRGHVMMSDTPMERRSNSGFLNGAHGHVLIAGLGLGMIVFPLLEKEFRNEILSVTVIEKNPDVYDLILPHMPDDPRLAVFQDDIFTWTPHRAKFNTIYFDIWPDITTDNLKDMEKLHRRYGRFLDKKNDPKSSMDSWQRSLLKYHKKRNERSTRRWTL